MAVPDRGNEGDSSTKERGLCLRMMTTSLAEAAISGAPPAPGRAHLWGSRKVR